MSTGTITSAFADKPAGPYGKAIKVMVVALDEPYEYKAKNGTTMRAVTAAASDGTTLAKVMCYDQTKFKFLKVGQSVVLRDTIKRMVDGKPALVITSATKTFVAGPLDVPHEHVTEGKLLLNPPPSDVVPVVEALNSPVKKKVSVEAKIVQEDEARTVEVRGETVNIKTVTVEDKSGSGKVTLWRACASANVRPGDYVTITDVVPNTYQNKTTLSTTARSRVERCQAPECTKDVIVEGVCVAGGKAELFLQDGSCITVDAEMLQSALITEEDPVPDVELAMTKGPLSFCITSQGSEAMSIKLVTLLSESSDTPSL